MSTHQNASRDRLLLWLLVALGVLVTTCVALAWLAFRPRAPVVVTKDVPIPLAAPQQEVNPFDEAPVTPPPPRNVSASIESTVAFELSGEQMVGLVRGDELLPQFDVQSTTPDHTVLASRTFPMRVTLLKTAAGDIDLISFDIDVEKFVELVTVDNRINSKTLDSQLAIAMQVIGTIGTKLEPTWDQMKDLLEFNLRESLANRDASKTIRNSKADFRVDRNADGVVTVWISPSKS